MKKIIVLSALLLVLSAASVFSLGIGLRGNYGFGDRFGASLFISPGKKAGMGGAHFGINYWINKDAVSFGGTMDYWLFNPNITGPLNFYLGAGLFASISFGDPLALVAGLRVPIGLDLNFDRVDVFLEVAPQIGLSLLPTIGLNNGWGTAAVGVRFWF